MENITLQVAKRNVLGKRNRFLRREGITPIHVFGHNVASLALQCDTIQLKQTIAHAGTTRLISLKIEGEKRPKNVFVREIQRDSLGKNLLHVDFYQVKEGEKMAVDVPIVLVGEAPAMKGKGRMLTHGITSLHIECLPENVPPQIEVDISSLEDVEHPINVKDIVLAPDITVHADPEQLVVKVTEIMVRAEEAEVAADEEAAEAGEAAEAAPEQPAAEAPSEGES
jgi:large subunit ribosomal protein L25